MTSSIILRHNKKNRCLFTCSVYVKIKRPFILRQCDVGSKGKTRCWPKKIEARRAEKNKFENASLSSLVTSFHVK